MTNEGKEVQALKGKDNLTSCWQSDQPVLPTKEGNASGGKGLTVEPEVSGKHRPHTEGEQSMETRLGRLTEISRGNPQVQITSVAHYLDVEFLKTCYAELKKKTEQPYGLEI